MQYNERKSESNRIDASLCAAYTQDRATTFLPVSGVSCQCRQIAFRRKHFFADQFSNSYQLGWSELFVSAILWNEGMLS